MENVLRGLQYVEMLVYLDDIIVYAKSLKYHEKKMELLFERLRNANLKLQPEKVQFLKREVAFLGHIISEKGVKPNPEKIRAVIKFPTPWNVNMSARHWASLDIIDASYENMLWKLDL